MNARSYFDLSQSVTGPPVSRKAVAKEAGPPRAASQPSQQMSLLWQLAVYFVLVLSVLVSHVLDGYQAGVTGFNDLVWDWQHLLFAAIIALLVFPVAYDKAQLNKDRPVMLQIALVFGAGIGWENVVSAAAQAIAK